MMNKRFRRELSDWSVILFGVLLVSFGLDFLMIPNKIVAGGFSGLATISYHLFGLPVGTVMLLLNIAVFALGYRMLGKRFAIRSIVSSVLLSVFVDAIALVMHGFGISSLTDDIFLASIYGGLACGVGIGLILAKNSSTGGTDVIAQIINHKTGYNTGKLLVAIDIAITVLAALVFGPRIAMYGIITVAVTGTVVDLVIGGRKTARFVVVITDKPDRITRRILAELNRGATLLEGTGAYTGNKRKLIICIVRRRQVMLLRRIVEEEDPNAFLTFTQASEVLGRGFYPLAEAKSS